VRGLGGSACDPSNPDNRCPDREGKRCVVCELFGCTGWARKFRFDVRDENGQVKRDQIKKGETFHFRFTPLRPIFPEEWILLDLTLRLIAGYGAIGGKTVYKPSDEQARQNAPHHQDYGIMEWKTGPATPPIPGDVEAALRTYVQLQKWRVPNQDDFKWASLNNFWCVNRRYLARQDANTSSFNRVIGRPERKAQAQNGDSWLAGRRARGGARPQAAESKKVFSFKEPETARRTFGFVKPGLLSLDEMRQRLKGVWPDLEDEEFLTGPVILVRLLTEVGGGVR